MDAQEQRRLKPESESFLDRYAPPFGCPEAQGHARRFVQGLLLGGDRRRVENIAEAIDGCIVRSLQTFITNAPRDALGRGDKTQCSGTLGLTENCQVGVFLGYHATKATP